MSELNEQIAATHTNGDTQADNHRLVIPAMRGAIPDAPLVLANDDSGTEVTPNGPDAIPSKHQVELNNHPRPAQPGPKIVMMSQVTPREISWLWPGRIPIGHLTLLWGDPGEGKTQGQRALLRKLGNLGAFAPGRLVHKPTFVCWHLKRTEVSDVDHSDSRSLGRGGRFF